MISVPLFTGKCIQQRWRCDRDDDCGDNSDEKNCPTPQCDSDQYFKCADGLCVSQKWRCDGDPDCPDGSDERVNFLLHIQTNSIRFRKLNRNPSITELSKSDKNIVTVLTVRISMQR